MILRSPPPVPGRRLHSAPTSEGIPTGQVCKRQARGDGTEPGCIHPPDPAGAFARCDDARSRPRSTSHHTGALPYSSNMKNMGQPEKLGTCACTVCTEYRARLYQQVDWLSSQTADVFLSFVADLRVLHADMWDHGQGSRSQPWQRDRSDRFVEKGGMHVPRNALVS